MTKHRDDCSVCFNAVEGARCQHCKRLVGPECWLCGGSGLEPTTVIISVPSRDLRPGDQMISTRGVLTVTDVRIVPVDTGRDTRDAVHVRFNGEDPKFTANYYLGHPWTVMRCVDDADAKRIARHFLEPTNRSG